MKSIFWKLIFVFLALSAFLIWRASNDKTLKVYTVSELSKLNEAKRIRIAGRVIEEGLSYKTEPTHELRFRISEQLNPGTSLVVVYNGLKPDMFAAGRDVIIDGNYHNSEIQAVELLTQCPSKYEPPTPGNEK